MIEMTRVLYRLMQVKSIVLLQKSILQYFRPSLSYYLSLRPLICLCLSGRLRQVKTVMRFLEQYCDPILTITSIPSPIRKNIDNTQLPLVRRLHLCLYILMDDMLARLIITLRFLRSELNA